MPRTKKETAAAEIMVEDLAEKKPARKTAAKAVEQVFVQFGGNEAEVSALVAAAKEAFKAEKPRTAVKELKLYVKPEEAAAYYVINGTFDGKVSF